jgi:hypothetical protein
MNPSLTSTLSVFTKKSEFSKSGLAAELSDEPPLHPSELHRIARARLWLGKFVPFAFARFQMIFFIGVTATLAWQSYGGAARETIATWSPHLVWVAPPATPAGASAEQIVAISRDLAVVRQSVDKLATDVNRLQAPQQGVSSSPPSPAGVPVRKPAPQTPSAARAAPLILRAGHCRARCRAYCRGFEPGSRELQQLLGHPVSELSSDLMLPFTA